MDVPGSSHEKYTNMRAILWQLLRNARLRSWEVYNRSDIVYPLTTDFATAITAGGEKGTGEENVYENHSSGNEEQKTIYILWQKQMPAGDQQNR